jgi:hypothetical protein
MIWKLVGYGKWAAKLMLIEMFVPGGTLIVLSVLLTGRFFPVVAHRIATLVPFRREDRRPEQGGDLIAYYALRRMR